MTTLTDNRPGDFDAYWASVQEELAGVPAAPEVDELPLRSTDYATAYVVHMTSIGPYRIFAHLSIPKGAGPFPTRYYLPRYGSVVEQIPQGFTNAQRREYVTFSVGVRGQRGADQPFAAAFPGLLTHDISDHEGYVFRDIAADCVRGLEYLVTRPEVDRSKVVAMGGDLALATAALGLRPHPLGLHPGHVLRDGGPGSAHRGVSSARDQRLPAPRPVETRCGDAHPVLLRPALARPQGGGAHPDNDRGRRRPAEHRGPGPLHVGVGDRAGCEQDPVLGLQGQRVH